MERCAICGSKLHTIKDRPYDYKESGLNVKLIGIPMYTCESCDEEFVSIPSPDKLHKAIGIDICKNKKALLLPEEIRFLRKELQLKAKELARLIGVTDSTVSRWENGDKQIGEGNDRLLRAIYLNCMDDRSNCKDRCTNLIHTFENIPTKRKQIKVPHEVVFNPQEWLMPELSTCQC